MAKHRTLSSALFSMLMVPPCSVSRYGLAIADLSAARSILAALPSDPQIVGAIERLDRTLGNLPDLPVAAAGDLDIAWQTLLAPTAVVVPDPAIILPEPPVADVPPTSPNG